jgi:hypothetical protein
MRPLTLCCLIAVLALVGALSVLCSTGCDDDRRGRDRDNCDCDCRDCDCPDGGSLGAVAK